MKDIIICGTCTTVIPDETIWMKHLKKYGKGLKTQCQDCYNFHSKSEHKDDFEWFKFTRDEVHKYCRDNLYRKNKDKELGC